VPCSDGEGAKTPEDDSTGGENKSAGKGAEPAAKKRKIFPNDPDKVESPEEATACAHRATFLLCWAHGFSHDGADLCAEELTHLRMVLSAM
jgi:hypothetical protein